MDRIKTKSKGVYYREHPTRKNGIRKDRYYYLRYTLDGHQREEGFGWESSGYTEAKAAAEIETIRNNIKNKCGYFSLKEKNEMAENQKKAQQMIFIEQEKENITYRKFFNDIYKPSYIDVKKIKEWKIGMHETYILPIIGDMRMIDIKPVHIEQIKTIMADKGLVPSTINKAIIYIGHVFNIAKANNYYSAESPTTKVKRLKKDNRRMRFLSHDEASILLSKLKEMKTNTVFDMALLALCCGLRAGEICKLQKVDINFNIKKISIRDPKGVVNRILPMPQIVVAQLKKRCEKLQPNDYLFLKTNGNGHITEVSNVYQKIADKLFNQNITDSRNKVVFHTLRHTFASWLAMDGVDVYTIKELMGHANVEMTMRYMHLAPNKFENAIACLENSVSFD